MKVKRIESKYNFHPFPNLQRLQRSATEKYLHSFFFYIGVFLERRETTKFTQAFIKEILITVKKNILMYRNVNE
jgi:hypothetical protein